MCFVPQLHKGRSTSPSDFPKSRQRVGNARRNLLKIFSRHDLIILHFVQHLGQHFLADAGDQAAQLTEAARTRSEIP